MRSALRKWRQSSTPGRKRSPDRLAQDAEGNLRALVSDTRIPAAVRQQLAAEFEEIEHISQKLRQQEIHIAAVGRVGVGKSSLLNALIGRPVFRTSPLHGETRNEARDAWVSLSEGQVLLIDTPGIDELDGAERADLADRIGHRADIVLLVCEGDLTDIEFSALERLRLRQKLVILVLNKADRFTAAERESLLGHLRARVAMLLPSRQVVTASADPRPETVITVDASGNETEARRSREPELGDLKALLFDILEKDGKSMAALNASIFASELDTQIATRIVTARKQAAEGLIRKYCIAKALLVAANPVPVTDLLAAAGVDVALVLHLGELYGFRLSRREASKLLLTISAQLVALMGAYWGVNLVSSALKTASVGLSTALTAGAQGALAWYATYLTGKIAQSWFSRGKSWGKSGPRETARQIVNSLDRDSLLRRAREEITARYPDSA